MRFAILIFFGKLSNLCFLIFLGRRKEIECRMFHTYAIFEDISLNRKNFDEFVLACEKKKWKRRMQFFPIFSFKIALLRLFIYIVLVAWLRNCMQMIFLGFIAYLIVGVCLSFRKGFARIPWKKGKFGGRLCLSLGGSLTLKLCEKSFVKLKFSCNHVFLINLNKIEE